MPKEVDPRDPDTWPSEDDIQREKLGPRGVPGSLRRFRALLSAINLRCARLCRSRENRRAAEASAPAMKAQTERSATKSA
jgi:hypothetical protein